MVCGANGNLIFCSATFSALIASLNYDGYIWVYSLDVLGVSETLTCDAYC